MARLKGGIPYGEGVWFYIPRVSRLDMHAPADGGAALVGAPLEPDSEEVMRQAAHARLPTAGDVHKI